MDGTLQQQIESDLQLEGTSERAAAAHAEALQREIHTAIPGIIKGFDPVKQTATVQPAIKTLFQGGEFIDLPLCVDVPVIFPAGGDIVLTFPVTDGDECWLMFSERAIDNWWDQGGTQEPSEYRFHDRSDGCALVGISSRPRFLSPGVATDAAELRTRDGVTKISIKAGEVTVTSSKVTVVADTVELGADSLDPTTLGVVLAGGIDTFTGATYGVLGSSSTAVMAKKA